MHLEEFSPRNAFEKNVKLLKHLGLLLQPTEPIYKICKYRRFLYVFVLVIPIIFLSFFKLFASESNNLDTIQDILVLVELISLGCKVLPFLLYPRFLLKKIIDVWKSEIFNTHTKHDVKFLQSSFLEYKVIFWICTVVYLTSCANFILQQLSQTTRELPYHLWVPFDAISNRNVYILVSVYLHIVLIYVTIITTAVDTMIAGFMLHSATQLRLVKNIFQNMSEYVEDDLNKVSSELGCTPKKALINKLVYKRILKCIGIHNAVVGYAKDLESAFSLPIFIEFLAHVVELAVSILQLVKLEMLSYDFFIAGFDMIIYMLQIYLFCYYGTLLHDESATIKDAIYMSEWYNYDEKSKKSLLILMERLKRPIQMTAGKLLDMSLDTFTDILKRTSSLFAVLKSFNIEATI